MFGMEVGLSGVAKERHRRRTHHFLGQLISKSWRSGPKSFPYLFTSLVNRKAKRVDLASTVSHHTTPCAFLARSQTTRTSQQADKPQSCVEARNFRNDLQVTERSARSVPASSCVRKSCAGRGRQHARPPRSPIAEPWRSAWRK
jgi:hypothetical protein